MFKVLKDFKGSPDGIVVIQYTAGDEVELVPSLAEVAVKEKWVKEIPAPKPRPPEPRQPDPLIAEIEAIAAAIQDATDPAQAAELQLQLEAKQAELAQR